MTGSCIGEGNARGRTGGAKEAESDKTRALPRVVLAVMLIPFSRTRSSGSGSGSRRTTTSALNPRLLVSLCPSIADLLTATARLLATALHGFVPLWYP